MRMIMIMIMNAKDQGSTITNNRLNFEINGNSHKVLKMLRSKEEQTSLRFVEVREDNEQLITTIANLELCFCSTLISNLSKLKADSTLACH